MCDPATVPALFAGAGIWPQGTTEGRRHMLSDLGLLIMRLVIGGLLMGHGSQKLFGWFGG